MSVSHTVSNEYQKLQKIMKKMGLAKLSNVFANPPACLQTLHYVLIDFDNNIYKEFLEKDYELFSKNDLRFCETIFQIIIKELGIKPGLTVQQFLSPGYLERKLWLITKVANAIYEKSGKKTSKVKKQREPRISEEEEPELFHSLPVKSTLDNSSSVVMKIPAIASPELNLNPQDYKISPENQFKEEISDEEEYFQRDSKVNAYVVKEISEEKENISSFSNINKSKPKFDDSEPIKQESDISSELKGEILSQIILLNKSVGGIITKFNDFQSQVGTWMSNINAQVSLLESNLKVVKNQVSQIKNNF